MKETISFRARFRFRLHKKLNIADKKHVIEVAKREVAISSPTPDMLISESEWLVMNARGFESENDARTFASKLKAASEISAAATRLGIDSGTDVRTASLGQAVKDRIREETGALMRDNIHGVDVFVDDPNVRIFSMHATGMVLATPDPFLSDIATLYDETESMSKNSKDVILLLNYALMRPEPVAQIIFATSAVEMLGQQEDWSPDQKRLLEKLADSAKTEITGTENERDEVSAAIRRGTYKIGLRQGVLRLLDKLDLSHLKRKWDELYGRRSTLVHGLAPKAGANYSDLAFETVSLCGEILLKVVAKEVTTADLHIDKFYRV